MKKISLFFFLIFLPLLANSENARTIHLAKAGTLSEYISEEEKYQIEELTLTGKINGTDFRLLRDMGGNNYLGQKTLGKLKYLDMTGVEIVSGGLKYIETKWINWSFGEHSGGCSIDNEVKVESNKFPYHVFTGCTIRTVLIPQSVVTICEKAFSDSQLENVVIPNSVKSIESGAFDWCYNLKSLNIPSSVTNIHFLAVGNESLEIICVDKNNPVYDSRDNCNAIIETATSKLLFGCKNTIIPPSVKSIGNSAFHSCYGLTSIVIPNGVSFIDSMAFYLCTGLTSVTIPITVTVIGWGAFYGCSDLASITIPENLTWIEGSAFTGCSGLASIKVESGNTRYDSRDNCNAIIETASNTLMTGCANSKIPNSVKSIGEGAFSGCALTSVTIPNSVISIGRGAFYHCSGLTSVTIPNSVTSIGDNAFLLCTSLTSITIPNSVTSIGSSAFESCSNLKDFYCFAEKVPGTGNDVFRRTPDDVTLYVPVGSVEAYKATSPWNSFKNIVGITAKVKLSKSKATIEKGKTLTLKATVTPESLKDKSVTWKSSNTQVATVSSSGKVKGVKTGTAIITCTSVATGMSATCKVTIGKVNLNKSEAIILKGTTFKLAPTVYPTTLTDKSVIWESSNNKVATVTSVGEVKGVKTGTATITCTSKATGFSATCEVTVGKVNLDKSEAIILKGSTLKLTSTVYPTTLTDKSVIWESSNNKVATVTSAGEVKGVKTGTATITCTSKATGLSTTCNVTVGKVNLDKTEVSIVKGKTVTLVPSVYPTTLADKSVTWKSSNTAIASVTTDGKVKGIKAGTATITCTSNVTGLSATCQVTVTASSGTRSLSGDDDETTGIDALGEGETKPYDVYDLSGRMVLHQVTSLDGLPNGIYIVNGRKVLKRE